MNRAFLQQKACRQFRAFTLLEMIVAAAVFMLMLLMLFSLTEITSRTWKDTTEKMQSFEGARAAFDRVTASLSQATLGTYWDYDNPSTPTLYERRSELQFLSLPMTGFGASFTEAAFPTHGLFFQAPTGTVANKATLGGLPQLLNAFGYFVEYGDDAAERPAFLPATVTPRYRYRLKEWNTTAEKFLLYANSSGVNGRNYLGAQSLNWINLSSPPARTIAENVIALVINPKNPEMPSGTSSLLTTDYYYNSRNNGTSTLEKSQRHQLPPEVEIIMVAIDDTSAIRILKNASTSPNLGAGLFSDTTPVVADQPRIESDLKELTDELTRLKIRYIVLRSSVKIRGARWSQD